MMSNSSPQRFICELSLKTCMIRLFLCICMLSAWPTVIWARNSTENNDKSANPIITFYQRHISGIDGNRCPMYPSCSQYCTQAVRKHGFGLGWIMACDRLLRCGRDEVHLSPHVRINGRESIFDPVGANDFWWFSPESPAIENDSTEKKLYHSYPAYPDRMSDLNPDHQQ